MNITQADNKIIAEIYDSAIDPSKWNHALEQVSRQIEADGIVLFVEDLSHSGFSICAYNSIYTNDFNANFMQHVQPQEEERFPEIANAPAQIIHTDMELNESEEIADAMPGMKHLNRELGMKFRAVSCLHNNGVWLDVISCQYKFPRSSFTQGRRDKANLFLPHIAKVIELNRPFHILKKRFEAVLASLDFLHFGIFILEPNKSVVVSNKEAERILDLGDGIGVDQKKKMFITDDNDNAVLQKAIDDSLSSSGSEVVRAESVLLVKRRPGKDSFLVEVCPFRDNKTEFENDFYGAFVLVFDPENRSTISTKGMQLLYKLTNAESLVCELVAEGLTTAEIADRREVSTDTVKSQFTSLFQKTRTQNRTQLARLATQINIPIDENR